MLRALLKRMRPGASPALAQVESRAAAARQQRVRTTRRRQRDITAINRVDEALTHPHAHAHTHLSHRRRQPLSTEAATASSSSASADAAGGGADSAGAGGSRLDALNRAYATGRRKTSVARVWLREGEGRIVVNDRELHEYFGRAAYRDKLVEPFAVTGTAGRFDVQCTVKGGGTTGQVGAIALGISRALEVFDPAHRPALAKESLFTRDARKVERKKPGQPKARKKDQWVKR